MSYLIRRVLAKLRLILDEMCRLHGKFASYFSSYKWPCCVGLSNFLAFFTWGVVTLLVGGRLRIIECIVYIQDNRRTRRTHKKKKQKRKKRKESHRLDKNSIDISGKGVTQIACTARLLIFFFPLSTRERALCSFISILVDPRKRRNELVSEGKAERITIQPSVSNY